MINEELLIDILKDQVVPALGCTDPMAVAYAVAVANKALGEETQSLDIYADRSILKNGKEVGIPGTDKKGIVISAALALTAGNPEYKLQVLKDVTNESLEQALKIMDKNIITLSLKKDVKGLYIEVVLKGKNNIVRVIIKKAHLNIVLVEKNGQELQKNETDEMVAKPALRDRIKEFKICELKEFVDNVEYKKIQFINEGIEMNKNIAGEGMQKNLGLGLGNLFKTNPEDFEQLAKALTAAASETRMSGHPMPVMSSAGSGNHGIVAILPIAVIGEGLKVNDEKIARAVTLSHLVTVFIKSYTGALSPMCGCGVAAGVGCTAGLAYIYDGSQQQIEGAIKNMTAGVAGMICDGAKLGCACKLIVAVSSAIDAAKMAMNNIFIPYNDGILDQSVEKTIINLGKVCTEGMANTDEVILDVMMDRCI